METTVEEVIFIGLPGPTHNYGGLSGDNVASSSNRGRVSNPKEAALQVLQLVRLLKSLGLEVGILPPQLRPSLALLSTRFSGDAKTMIARAAQEAPELLEAACSSSAMWVANAATVTPSCDSADGMLHLTAANLATNRHRRIEAADTCATLKEIFAHVPKARVHEPLDAQRGLRDEGAANHMRLAPSHSASGLNVFVYGTDGNGSGAASARQTLSASQVVKIQHRIVDAGAVFVKQHPQAIAQGVFHNDVIAVSHASFLLAHESAYAEGAADFARIEAAYHALHPGEKLNLRIVRDHELTVEEAVRTYFFNSQLVTSNGRMHIIAPEETRALFGGKAARLLESICADVHYADLRQSMNNGGGPACLRLRVPMTRAQLASVKEHTNVMAYDGMLQALEKTIEKHYPNAIAPHDLADPALYERSLALLTELSALLELKLV